jgi:hypothetical protein
MATRFIRSGEISLGELVEAMATLRPGRRRHGVARQQPRLWLA